MATMRCSACGMQTSGETVVCSRCGLSLSVRAVPTISMPYKESMVYLVLLLTLAGAFFLIVHIEGRRYHPRQERTAAPFPAQGAHR